MVPFLDPLMLATCGFFRNSLWEGYLPVTNELFTKKVALSSLPPPKKWCSKPGE